MNQLVEEAIDPKQQTSFYVDYGIKGSYFSMTFKDLQNKQMNVGYFIQPSELTYHLRTPTDYPQIKAVCKCFVATCMCLALTSLLHMFIMFGVVEDVQEAIEFQALYILILVGICIYYIVYVMKKRRQFQKRVKDYYGSLNRDIFLPNGVQIDIKMGCHWKGYKVTLRKIRCNQKMDSKQDTDTTS